MTTPNSTRTSHGTSDRDASQTYGGAGQAYDKAADVGRRAAEGAKEAVSEAAASVGGEARRMLDQQIDTGAAYLGHAASSLRTAAGDLSRNAPPLAGLADLVAEKLDNYASAVKGKSAEEVWQSAVDFTRRQPALVFGLASLAGFLAYRTVKNTQPASRTVKTAQRSSRSNRTDTRAREFHGA